jgi:hypothetical protein
LSGAHARIQGTRGARPAQLLGWPGGPGHWQVTKGQTPPCNLRCKGGTYRMIREHSSHQNRTFPSLGRMFSYGESLVLSPDGVGSSSLASLGVYMIFNPQFPPPLPLQSLPLQTQMGQCELRKQAMGAIASSKGNVSRGRIGYLKPNYPSQQRSRGSGAARGAAASHRGQGRPGPGEPDLARLPTHRSA